MEFRIDLSLVAADLSVVAYDEQPAIVSAIDIADNAAERIQSVHEMVDGIEKLLAEKAAQQVSDAALGS